LKAGKMAVAGVVGSDTDPVAHVTVLEHLVWRSGVVVSPREALNKYNSLIFVIPAKAGIQ